MRVYGAADLIISTHSFKTGYARTPRGCHGAAGLTGCEQDEHVEHFANGVILRDILVYKTSRCEMDADVAEWTRMMG